MTDGSTTAASASESESESEPGSGSTPAPADRSERLLRGYSGRLLVAVSLGWLAVQAGRLVLSPMLTEVRADLAMSETAAGFAFTLLWGLYALLQYPSGRLADALSRRTPIVVGLLLAAGGFTVLATAPTYPVFLAGAAVVGVGAGLYPTPARALVTDLFERKRGRAFGLHTASGDVGGVAAAGLAAVVTAVAVWRAAYLPVVVVVLGVAVAVHVWSREAYEFGTPALALCETLVRLFTARKAAALLAAYSLFAFTWQATASFLPTYLEVGKTLSPAVADAAFAILFGVGALVKPFAGWLGDRVPRALLAPAVLGVGAAALFGVVLGAGPVVVTGSVVVFAAGLMSFPPVMQAHLMDTFPADSAGGDLGATRTVYIGLGSLGPTYVGAVAQRAGYDLAFLGLVCTLGLGAALAVWSARQ